VAASVDRCRRLLHRHRPQGYDGAGADAAVNFLLRGIAHACSDSDEDGDEHCMPRTILATLKMAVL
jgi:hypothetical protein